MLVIYISPVRSVGGIPPIIGGNPARETCAFGMLACVVYMVIVGVVMLYGVFVLLAYCYAYWRMVSRWLRAAYWKNR